MATDVNFGTQQYFGFDPRTVPGCVLWLDGTDPTYSTPPANGAAVSTWFDKSGLSNNATGYNTPTYASNAINTVGGISLTSAQHFRATPASLLTSNSMTTFAVATTTVALPRSGGDQRLVSFSTNSTTRDYDNTASVIALFNQTTSSTIGTYRNGWIASNAIVQNTPFMAVSLYNGANGFIFFNGSAGSFTGTGSSGNFNVGAYGIGNAANNTTEYWNGFIGEVITYNRNLSSNERQTVEGYLAWKWRLQANLPSSHPYKAVRPIMRNFQPVDLEGGTLLWLDAADTRTITGSPVTQWTDKSGRGSNATTGSGSVVAGTAINSLNTLRFGFNNRLYMSNFVMPSSQTSVFYVIRGITRNTGGGTGYFILARQADDFSTFSGNEQFFAYQNLAAGRSYIAHLGPGGERNWGNLSTTAFFESVNVIATTGISYASSNGLSLPSVRTDPLSNTVFTATTYQISTTRSCCGDVYTYDLGELVVCDGTVSIASAQQMEGYLAWKWGVQRSLPTTHPYYRVLPSTPLFTPAQLSGLVLWMDPTDSTTLTLSGSSVTQWRDKSASGATFTTVNGNPTYTPSLINGLPGIDLTNASGFISSATQTLTSSLTMAMILVVKSGIGAWGSFFTHGSRDLDIALERNSISAGTTLQFQTANDNSGANLTFTTDQVSLYLGTMTTGTSRFFERFGGGTTTTTTATNSSTITVGLQTIRIGRSDVGENCNSFIGEIVYYNRVLSTQERQRVEGYLAWKWGLQLSLPSTHPYSKFRP
jgi:hypothetical protein